jgi:hypothetical protein
MLLLLSTFLAFNKSFCACTVDFNPRLASSKLPKISFELAATPFKALCNALASSAESEVSLAISWKYCTISRDSESLFIMSSTFLIDWIHAL